jgi:hypothetical protein
LRVCVRCCSCDSRVLIACVCVVAMCLAIVVVSSCICPENRIFRIMHSCASRLSEFFAIIVMVHMGDRIPVVVMSISSVCGGCVLLGDVFVDDVGFGDDMMFTCWGFVSCRLLRVGWCRVDVVLLCDLVARCDWLCGWCVCCVVTNVSLLFTVLVFCFFFICVCVVCCGVFITVCLCGLCLGVIVLLRDGRGRSWMSMVNWRSLGDCDGLIRSGWGVNDRA